MTAVTAVSHALIEALEASQNCPVGIRIGLRPPEIHGSLRMIGLATLEVPILMNPQDGLRDATAVARALAHARDNGHIGECGIRNVLSWPAGADLYEILIVPETEMYEDEWAARGGSTDSWPEISAWRREVSPSLVTAYLHVSDTEFQFGISSPHDAVDELCSQVTTSLERVLNR